MPSLYTVKTITNIEQALAVLENKWRILTEVKSDDINLQENQTLQCFMSCEWLVQWLQTYKDYIHELKVICILYNDETIAIAPFYISTIKTVGVTTNTLSFIATNEPENCEVASEFIDIAYSPNHKKQIIELLSEQLLKLKKVNQFRFKDLHIDSLMYSICQKIKQKMLTYEEQVSGYQFITKTSPPFEYSASFLKKKKRILNKYSKVCTTNDCQFFIAHNKKDALKLYEELTQLHQKRWQKRNKPGVFSNTYFYQFHKKFIERYFDKGMVVLSAIKIDKQIISVNYSIKWHDTLYFYQSGIDELHKPILSPGLLNHLLLINYCEQENISQYNLLKSSKTDDYKRQLAQLSDELLNISMLSFNKFNYLPYSMKSIKTILRSVVARFKYE